MIFEHIEFTWKPIDPQEIDLQFMNMQQILRDLAHARIELAFSLSQSELYASKMIEASATVLPLPEEEKALVPYDQ